VKNNELILILDFGGQYNQLIARRVRECNVYSEVVPFDISIEKIKEKNPKGIIFTGGPASVYGENAPRCAEGIFELGIPVLGICYGMQLMTYTLGGNVARADKREYGTTDVSIDNSSLLFEGFENTNGFLMSHTDFVEKVPEGFKNIGHTTSCPNAAMENKERNLYGIQFHPEVNSSINGTQVIRNFLFNICKCSGDWIISSFVEESIAKLKEKIGDKKALCALSGGVDSSVAAVLLSRAIGKNLTCIFVDHGLLRKNEGDEVEEVFKNQDINFIRVNAKDRFLAKLAGVTDPERKRKIIGEEFIRVFEEEAKKIGTVDFLVQGTIYPDVIESGLGKSSVIKSHHNVGGLPDYVDFKEIVEPLRDLFKDEVRKTGLELGMPENLVFRQPFPGPGLAIRIIGDITEVNLLNVKADYIIHAASQTSSKGFISNPVETINVSFEGTKHLLEFARTQKLKRFIYLSTMEVYGTPKTDEKIGELFATNLDTMKVRSCYPESKRMCENLCVSYATEYDVPINVLRLTQTFGKGVEYNDSRVFAEFARCVIENKNIILKTKGETKRSYLNVKDAVNAIFKIMISDVAGQVFNVANENTYCSIREMAEMVANNIAEERISVNFELNEDDSLGYAPKLCMNLDTAKLKRLGWEANYSLEDTFIEMILWMREHKND